MNAHSAGRVAAFGFSMYGQCGTGATSSIRSPRLLAALDGVCIAAVTAGEYHSAALSADGAVYTWGKGDDGQLGLGATGQAVLPTQVVALDGIRIASVSAGGAHTVALDAAGNVFAWGRGSSGQLGTGGTGSECSPVAVSFVDVLDAGERIVDIAAGSDFTLFLTSAGGVLATGSGMYGRLGTGSTLSALSPVRLAKLDGASITHVAAGTHCGMALSQSTGAVYAWGFGKLSPTPMDQLMDLGITAVAAGQYHGAASALALVQPLPQLSFVDVAAGDDHTLALAADGSLYSWGNDMYGRLGRPTAGDEPGCASPGVPALVPGLATARVRALAAGGAHSLVVIVGAPASSPRSSGGRPSLRQASASHRAAPSKAERMARLSAMLSGKSNGGSTPARASRSVAAATSSLARTHEFQRYAARQSSRGSPRVAAPSQASAVFWNSPNHSSTAAVRPSRTPLRSSPLQTLPLGGASRSPPVRSVAATLQELANAELGASAARSRGALSARHRESHALADELANSRASLEATKRTSERLRRDMDALAAQRARLARSTTELSASLRASTSSIEHEHESARVTRDASIDAFVRMADEVEALQTETEVMQDSTAALSDSRASLEALRSSVAEEHTVVSHQIEALERELALAHADSESAVAHHARLAQAVEAQLLSKNEVEDALEAAASTLRVELARVREQCTRLSAALDQADSALTALKTRRDGLQSELAEKAGEEDELVTAINEASASIDAKTAAIHDHNASLAKLVGDEGRLGTELAELADRKASADARVLTLAAQVEEAEARRASVEAQVASLAKQLGEAQGGYTALQSEFKAKAAELDTIRGETTRVREAIAHAEADTATAKETLERERGVFARASALRDSTLDQLSETKAARVTMEKEVHTLQAELAEAQAEAQAALEARNKAQRELETEQEARRVAMSAKAKLEEAVELERESRLVALAAKERSALQLEVEQEKKLALATEEERLSRAVKSSRAAFRSAAATAKENAAYAANLQNSAASIGGGGTAVRQTASRRSISPRKVAATKARVAQLLSTLDPEHAPALAATHTSPNTGERASGRPKHFAAVERAKRVLHEAKASMAMAATLEAVDVASPGQIAADIPRSQLRPVNEVLESSVAAELDTAERDVRAARAKLDAILATAR
ncbi:UVB-resistance protein UVR8 [Thecamonas trahens ATCC 50062]|uniref:UVB-resistance protein UVR8 n=1 Tax=Thecamonas trahens ATCC 50062 TaxID=461836 RepID=A0A0L0DFW5_THETB|nr:UVB-resistance protein UVR8 [Thecamonas trahens ATCC 50062]KNC50223.1 UVB-resistance protein UVR8 [Thecamonas trahens ATCC 50062]|eukprot:XP_013757056.1 UVB-resistance protein UVR8 [Thecamonas trahens ATCC 50062]